jgi:hypothetical protein
MAGTGGACSMLSAASCMLSVACCRTAAHTGPAAFGSPIRLNKLSDFSRADELQEELRSLEHMLGKIKRVRVRMLACLRACARAACRCVCAPECCLAGRGATGGSGHELRARVPAQSAAADPQRPAHEEHVRAGLLSCARAVWFVLSRSLSIGVVRRQRRRACVPPPRAAIRARHSSFQRERSCAE